MSDEREEIANDCGGPEPPAEYVIAALRARLAEVERELLSCGKALATVQAKRSTELTNMQTLEERARARVRYGHNDTCSQVLVPDTPCSCGHSSLADALGERTDG